VWRTCRAAVNRTLDASVSSSGSRGLRRRRAQRPRPTVAPRPPGSSLPPKRESFGRTIEPRRPAGSSDDLARMPPRPDAPVSSRPPERTLGLRAPLSRRFEERRVESNGRVSPEGTTKRASLTGIHMLRASVGRHRPMGRPPRRDLRTKRVSRRGRLGRLGISFPLRLVVRTSPPLAARRGHRTSVQTQEVGDGPSRGTRMGFLVPSPALSRPRSGSSPSPRANDVASQPSPDPDRSQPSASSSASVWRSRSDDSRSRTRQPRGRVGWGGQKLRFVPHLRRHVREFA
jgi:hypothetical protein